MENEEKKAIKGLEWSQQQMRLGNLPDYDQGHYADIRIVLNLIEKQQKEIEELKEKNEFLNWYFENQKGNFIHKDKIKAKMKEEEWSLENYDCDESDYKQSQAIGAWSVLQSLLEKE